MRGLSPLSTRIRPWGFRDMALAPVPRKKRLCSTKELRPSSRANHRYRLVWQGQGAGGVSVASRGPARQAD